MANLIFPIPKLRLELGLGPDDHMQSVGSPSQPVLPCALEDGRDAGKISIAEPGHP